MSSNSTTRWKKIGRDSYNVEFTLNWNYNEGYVDISMPNYVAKKLTKYRYMPSKRQQYCPYEPNPIRYGKYSDNIVHEK